MLSYHDLKQDARVLRAFTSLDPDEFEILLMAFQNAWSDHITQHYVQRKSRKRRYGGGRKPHLLAIEDKLLFIRPRSWDRPLYTLITSVIGKRSQDKLFKINTLIFFDTLSNALISH